MGVFDVIYYLCYSCNWEHGERLVPILATTVFTPCVEPTDVDIPKTRLFIASRSTHSTPSRAFSLTSEACSQPCAPQNEPISKLKMPIMVQPSLNLMCRQPFFNLAHPSLKFGTAFTRSVQGKTLSVPWTLKEFVLMSMGRVLIHRRGSNIKGQRSLLLATRA